MIFLQLGIEKLQAWMGTEPTTSDFISQSQVPINIQPRQEEVNVSMSIEKEY